MRALISIGTNSTRLLIAERNGARWIPVRHFKRVTRLGEGLGASGELLPRAVARTLEAALSFAAIARHAGAQTRAIATSAMRRCANAGALIDPLAGRAGVGTEIVSGQDEARYSFLGALAGHGQGLGAHACVGVLDVGGGSTELAVGTPSCLERSRSFEIGAVRLTEATALREDPPAAAALEEARKRAREALAGIGEAGAGVELLIGVGGTITTSAAILTHGEREGELADGACIALGELSALADRLAPLSLAERMKTPGLPAPRADVIVAGLVVLEQAMTALGIESAIASIHDLLLGYIAAGWR